MKIAFFTDCYLDLTGGIVSSINATKTELERLGHTVYIFSTGFSRSREAQFELAKKNIFLVPSCKLFFRGLAPISRRPAIIERKLLEDFPELKDFDVFHIHYEAGCSIAGIRLAHKLNIPVVQTMHGREDMGETNLIPKGLRSFCAWAMALFQSWYLPVSANIKKDKYLALNYPLKKMWGIMINHANQADVVITPSKHFADKLKHYGVKKKICVVPNAVPDSLVEQKAEPRKLGHGEVLKLVWHSRVSEEKRMMPFLKALTMVEGDYIVDVYGGGGDYWRARAFVAKNNLNVFFYNTTPHDKIMAKVRGADLDVLVSYNFDTFGMTLIEAEAVGTPALICDPDLTEVLPRGGYVLADGPEPEKIAKAISDLIVHPDRISEMSEVMLAHRDEVRQSVRIKELLNVYEKVRKK